MKMKWDFHCESALHSGSLINIYKAICFQTKDAYGVSEVAWRRWSHSLGRPVRKGEELGLGDGVRKDSGSGEFTVSGREDTPGRSQEVALEALTVYLLCVFRGSSPLLGEGRAQHTNCRYRI